MKSDKVYLVGFMAAGKSTVAKALARRLAWSVEDLDELIENREQRSVAEIFCRGRRSRIPQDGTGAASKASSAAACRGGHRWRHVRRLGQPGVDRWRRCVSLA